MIIVKQGAVTQYIERDSTTLDAGDSVYLDAGVVHASYNDGDETAHLQVVIGPSLGDERLRARRRLGRGALGLDPLRPGAWHRWCQAPSCASTVARGPSTPRIDASTSSTGWKAGSGLPARRSAAVTWTRQPGFALA